MRSVFHGCRPVYHAYFSVQWILTGTMQGKKQKDGQDLVSYRHAKKREMYKQERAAYVASF